MSRDMLKIVLLALLGTPVLATAAGIDCGKATSVADKRICADIGLKQLDGQMTGAFEQANARAGAHADALLRDQRNWLAERNDVLRNSRLGPAVAKHAYLDRIALLQHLFNAGDEPASPLLAAIKAHAASAPAAMGGAWAALGGDGSVFRVADEQRGPSAAVTAHLPFDASPGLQQVLALVANDGAAYTTVVKLDAPQVGGLYTVTGSADCVNWTLFRWQGRAVEPIETPMTLRQNCAGAQGALVTFQNHAYALQVETEVATSDVQVQPYDGAARGDAVWGDGSRLLLRYDHKLLPPQTHCALDDCAGAIKQASDDVARYDHGRDATVFTADLTADETKHYTDILKQAGPGHTLQELPDFGTGVRVVPIGNPYSEFGEQSEFFPLRWHGELLLARIGNGVFGVQASDDWLLAAWRWDGHNFVPVLAMWVPVQRGDFLLGASVPFRFVSH